MPAIRSLARYLLAFALLPQFSLAVTYTTVDVPGSQETRGVYDINNAGQMVGAYYDTSGIDHGFLDSNGTFTTLDYPSAFLTEAHGINDSGQIVGQYCGTDGRCHGFYYDGTNYTTIEPANATYSALEKINDSQQITGFYEDAAGLIYGFVYDLSTNSYTRLHVPGSVGGSVAYGINNLGLVAGTYADIGNPTYHGYLYGGGHYQDLTYLTASETNPEDLNDSGEVVGLLQFTKSGVSVYHGFLFNSGAFSKFLFPGADYTVAYGVNNAGAVVGAYASGSTLSHGFLRTP